MFDWLINWATPPNKDGTPPQRLEEEHTRKIEIKDEKYLAGVNVDKLLQVMSNLDEDDRTGWTLIYIGYSDSSQYYLTKTVKRKI